MNTHQSALVLPWENPDEYTAFRNGILASHAPAGAHEQFLVEELADAAWAWRRARAVEKEYWEQIGGARNRGPAGVAEALVQERPARLEPFFRYMQAAERRYYKALAAVERATRRHNTRRAAPACAEPLVETGPLPDPAVETALAAAAGASPSAAAPAPAGSHPAAPAGHGAQQPPPAAHRKEPPRRH